MEIRNRHERIEPLHDLILEALLDNVASAATADG